MPKGPYCVVVYRLKDNTDHETHRTISILKGWNGMQEKSEKDGKKNRIGNKEVHFRCLNPGSIINIKILNSW